MISLTRSFVRCHDIVIPCFWVKAGRNWCWVFNSGKRGGQSCSWLFKQFGHRNGFCNSGDTLHTLSNIFYCLPFSVTLWRNKNNLMKCQRISFTYTFDWEWFRSFVFWQGNTQEELPEILLGTCRLNHLDVAKSLLVKPWKYLPPKVLNLSQNKHWTHWIWM